MGEGLLFSYHCSLWRAFSWVRWREGENIILVGFLCGDGSVPRTRAVGGGGGGGGDVPKDGGDDVPKAADYVPKAADLPPAVPRTLAPRSAAERMVQRWVVSCRRALGRCLRWLREQVSKVLLMLTIVSRARRTHAAL